jgi:Sulfotransferase domain
MFENVVIIAGVPRSGTSWLGEIINSSPDTAYRFQPIFSYAFKDAVNIESSMEDYQRFFNGIYESSDDFLLQTDKRESGMYPVFNKKDNPEFLAFKMCRYQYLICKMLCYFDNIKLVGIVRHPCAVINSWLKNQREFPQEADARKEWRYGACKNRGREEEFFGFYKWKEVAHLYLDLKDKYPQKVFVVKYETLVDNPLAISKQLFDFIGLDFSEQSEAFLKKCHSINIDSPYAVFKDKAVKERWQSELDPSIAAEIIEDIKGTRLARFL